MVKLTRYSTKQTLALTLAIVAFQVMPVMAGNRGALLTDSQATQAGLRAVWSAHVALDSTRAEIQQLVQYVGPKSYWVSFEVAYKDQVDVFSERDRNRHGRIIGIGGAKELAMKHRAEMIDFGYEVTITPKQHPIAPEIFVYALTSTCNVHCLDGETGQTVWVSQVGSRDYPGWINADRGYVAVVQGTNVYCLDGKTGEIIFDRKLRGVPSGSPVITEDNLFIPTLSGVVEEFSLYKPRSSSGATSSLGRILHAPMATSKSVAWVTDQGHLNLAMGNRISTLNRGVRFRLKTYDDILSSPSFLETLDNGVVHNYIMLATAPGNVYCIDENNGAIMWIFRTGQPIDISPISFGDQVFTATEDNLLFAIGLKSGRDQWRIPGIKQVISASKTRLYVMDSLNRLTALDRKTGNRIATLSTETLNLQLINESTDRIFIGSKNGLVQCLREHESTLPVFHRKVLQEKQKKIRIDEQGKKPTQAGAGGTEEVDPFAAGGDADPFAAGGGGGTMTEEKDPFADLGGGEDPFATDDPEMKDDKKEETKEEEKDPFDF